MKTENFINVDLHAHSDFSDGSLSVYNLIKVSAENNCKYLALTDHDTIDGISIAKECALEFQLNIISGVEISVTWNNNILLHILGLNVDHTSNDLIENLNNLRSLRFKRAQQIANNLSKIGIKDSLAGAMKYCKNINSLSRTHFNQFLVDNKYSKPGKAFDKYLAYGKPGYVDCTWASLTDAINWIKNSGGIPVLAHPGRYKMNNSTLIKLINNFKELGGEGIEVISPSHTLDDVHKFASLSVKFELLASAGNDFHTLDNGVRKIKPGLTRKLPYICNPIFNRLGLEL